MEKAFSTSVAGLELPLWKDVPQTSWLRRHGRTRVILVDDQWRNREHFFLVSDHEAPISGAEEYLLNWLNAEIQFMPMPGDYRYSPTTDSRPTGTFSDQWFENSLKQLIDGHPADDRPIAAILLDLLYGEESDIDDASGVRFLRIIRRHLPDIPVLIFSNLQESRRIYEKLKMGGHAEDEFFSSFEDFVPKSNPDNPNESRFERIAHKLVQHGYLSDPTVPAYSESMRKVALEMRQIVLSKERMRYENSPETYPTPVTIIGETGSGKGIIAEKLIQMSARRSNPIKKVLFTDATNDDVIKKLYGVGAYTDAPELFYTDLRTGAVVDRLLRGNHKQFPDHVKALGGLGFLQCFDMGDEVQKGSTGPTPKYGTVILDELGAAPANMQQRLISMLNNGQYTPEHTSYTIPTERRLDLWFLIPCTPSAFETIIGDIKSRLSRSRLLRIPTLAERSMDVLPLAMERMDDKETEHPIGRVFSPSAAEWLINHTRSLQVREFDGVLNELKRNSVPGKAIIFNAGDIKSAFTKSDSAHEKQGPGYETTRKYLAFLPSSNEVTPDFSHALVRTSGLQPPHKLGKYTLRNKLGSGGMGTVYRAFQEGLDRFVALKVLSPATPESDVQRFGLEAKSVAKLDHPNIIKIYDVGEQDQWRFFSMELIDGDNLAVVARDALLNPKVAAELMAKVAQGINYAHEAGIFHRDLKPSNILLKGNEPIVTDFGLAKPINSDLQITQAGQLMGSPSYMAPEQVKGDNNEPLSDVYAIGATLYRLITGMPPFVSHTIMLTFQQISEKEPLSPTLFGVDPPLGAICLKCLKKEPSERYSSAQELANELHRYLKNERIETSYATKEHESVNLASDVRGRFKQESGQLKFIELQHDNDLSNSAATVYEYLEWATAEVAATTSDRSPVDLWRYVSGGVTLTTNQAKSALAGLLMRHEPYARQALPESERLLQLAKLVKDRSKALEGLLNSLKG